MSKTSKGGAAATLEDSPSPWAGMTQAQMRAALEAYAANEQAREARDRRLAGVRIERSHGTSSAGKPYDNLKVSGGEFGSYGLKIRRDYFRRLETIMPDIEAALREHYGDDWETSDPA